MFYFVVIKKVLDEADASLAATNCGCSYVGHSSWLSIDRFGNNTFTDNGGDSELLRSFCCAAVSLFQPLTAIQVEGEIKNTLLLTLNHGEFFLGFSDLKTAEKTYGFKTFRNLASDLGVLSKLRVHLRSNGDMGEINEFTSKLSDQNLRHKFAATPKDYDAWENFIDDAGNELVDQCENIKFLKV